MTITTEKTITIIKVREKSKSLKAGEENKGT